MTDGINNLPTDPKVQQEMVLSLQSQVKKLIAEKDHLIEPFRLAQQQRFGTNSESHPAQGDLFNEAEAALDTIEDVVESTPTTVMKKPVRQKLSKDLVRKVIIHDISVDEKSCDCCGNQLQQMSEKLEFIPDKVKVIEHVRLKYSCRRCEKEGISTKIKSAPLPASPIPKSIATPSLLSQIITSKYQYALPLYRQESLFKQYGMP